MGIRTIRPTTPGNRFATRSDFEEITVAQPEKKLTKALRKSGGRNNKGRGDCIIHYSIVDNFNETK